MLRGPKAKCALFFRLFSLLNLNVHLSVFLLSLTKLNWSDQFFHVLCSSADT